MKGFWEQSGSAIGIINIFLAISFCHSTMNPPLVRVYVDQMLFCLILGIPPHLLTSEPLKTYGNTQRMYLKKACSQHSADT